MATGGVNKTEVQRARRTLLAQGINPSIDAVRVALGNTGSKSTIHRFLKELEAEEGPPGARVSTSDALQDLVGRLAAQLHQEADARIEEIRAQAAADRQAHAAVAERLSEEAAQFRAQAERADVALADTRTRLADTESQLQDARVAAAAHAEREAGLMARLAEQEAHTSSLEQKHVQAREALEHFRASAKEQREQEHRRHEHQIHGLQAEIRQLQEQLTGRNHELMQLNGEAARLTEQVGSLSKQLQQAERRSRQRDDEFAVLTGTRDELQALKGRWSSDIAALEQARRDLAEAHATLTAERDARTAAQAAAEAAIAQRATLEAVFAKWEIPRPPVPDAPLAR